MITQLKLMELFIYNPETGAFFWRIAGKGRALDIIAGTCSGDEHRNISIGYKQYKAHRLAWLYVFGAWPADQIDHINLVKDDNRICNLREASNSENQGNTCKRCTNTSGFKGVSWEKGRKKWQANIKINGKQTHLGRFDDLSDASAAYARAAEKHFGQFARMA